MYIIVNHSSRGRCMVMPAIYKSLAEGRKGLNDLLEKEKGAGYDSSYIGIHGDVAVISKSGAECWEKEYILQKLSFPKTIYAEAVPVRNYCGRLA